MSEYKVTRTKSAVTGQVVELRESTPVAVQTEPQPQSELLTPGGQRVPVTVEKGDPDLLTIRSPSGEERSFAIPRPYFEQDKK